MAAVEVAMSEKHHLVYLNRFFFFDLSFLSFLSDLLLIFPFPSSGLLATWHRSCGVVSFFVSLKSSAQFLFSGSEISKGSRLIVSRRVDQILLISLRLGDTRGYIYKVSDIT